MTRVARTFEPVAANAALYDELYRHVYRRMHDRLAPLHAASAASPATRRPVGAEPARMSR